MVPMSLTGYESIPADFSTEDWKRILLALQTYVINQEQVLKTKNVGDREWNELFQFDSIAKDIECFILTKSGEFNEL